MNLSGNYIDPDQPGWGLAVMHRPDLSRIAFVCYRGGSGAEFHVSNPVSDSGRRWRNVPVRSGSGGGGRISVEIQGNGEAARVRLPNGQRVDLRHERLAGGSGSGAAPSPSSPSPSPSPSSAPAPASSAGGGSVIDWGDVFGGEFPQPRNQRRELEVPAGESLLLGCRAPASGEGSLYVAYNAHYHQPVRIAVCSDAAGQNEIRGQTIATAGYIRWATTSKSGTAQVQPNQTFYVRVDFARKGNPSQNKGFCYLESRL